MLRSIRNVKLLKSLSLICLSPLFVFYSSLEGLSIIRDLSNSNTIFAKRLGLKTGMDFRGLV